MPLIYIIPSCNIILRNNIIPKNILSQHVIFYKDIILQLHELRRVDNYIVVPKEGGDFEDEAMLEMMRLELKDVFSQFCVEKCLKSEGVRPEI